MTTKIISVLLSLCIICGCSKPPSKNFVEDRSKDTSVETGKGDTGNKKGEVSASEGKDNGEQPPLNSNPQVAVLEVKTPQDDNHGGNNQGNTPQSSVFWNANRPFWDNLWHWKIFDYWDWRHWGSATIAVVVGLAGWWFYSSYKDGINYNIDWSNLGSDFIDHNLGNYNLALSNEQATLRTVSGQSGPASSLTNSSSPYSSSFSSSSYSPSSFGDGNGSGEQQPKTVSQQQEQARVLDLAAAAERIAKEAHKVFTEKRAKQAERQAAKEAIQVALTEGTDKIGIVRELIGIVIVKTETIKNTITIVTVNTESKIIFNLTEGFTEETKERLKQVAQAEQAANARLTSQNLAEAIAKAIETAQIERIQKQKQADRAAAERMTEVANQVFIEKIAEQKTKMQASLAVMQAIETERTKIGIARELIGMQIIPVAEKSIITIITVNAESQIIFSLTEGYEEETIERLKQVAQLAQAEQQAANIWSTPQERVIAISTAIQAVLKEQVAEQVRAYERAIADPKALAQMDQKTRAGALEGSKVVMRRQEQAHTVEKFEIVAKARAFLEQERARLFDQAIEGPHALAQMTHKEQIYVIKHAQEARQSYFFEDFPCAQKMLAKAEAVLAQAEAMGLPKRQPQVYRVNQQNVATSPANNVNQHGLGEQQPKPKPKLQPKKESAEEKAKREKEREIADKVELDKWVSKSRNIATKDLKIELDKDLKGEALIVYVAGQVDKKDKQYDDLREQAIMIGMKKEDYGKSLLPIMYVSGDHFYYKDGNEPFILGDCGLFAAKRYLYHLSRLGVLEKLGIDEDIWKSINIKQWRNQLVLLTGQEAVGKQREYLNSEHIVTLLKKISGIPDELIQVFWSDFSIQKYFENINLPMLQSYRRELEVMEEIIKSRDLEKALNIATKDLTDKDDIASETSKWRKFYKDVEDAGFDEAALDAEDIKYRRGSLPHKVSPNDRGRIGTIRELLASMGPEVADFENQLRIPEEDRRNAAIEKLNASLHKIMEES